MPIQRKNRRVLSESQDGCGSAYKWYLSWWEQNAQWFITEKTGGKMLKPGAFSLFPLLGFSIWIKWGVYEGRQWGQRWWEIGCGRKDILHLPIQSVVFSNFEMKEKNADGIAPEWITADCKVQKAWVRRWWGILHVGHFHSPFFMFYFLTLALWSPVDYFWNLQ